MSCCSGGRLSQRGVRPRLGQQQRQITTRSRGRKELRGQKKNVVTFSGLFRFFSWLPNRVLSWGPNRSSSYVHEFLD
ncbi:hypothetical protein CsSME_00018910 [Camellia sinensis var. sinensis]